MKYSFILTVAFFLIIFPVKIIGQDFYGVDEAREREASDLVKKALSRSLEKMLASGQVVTNHKIVISEHRKFLVVSYLINDKRALGGRMHSVYDPKSDKIVYVLGED